MMKTVILILFMMVLVGTISSEELDDSIIGIGYLLPHSHNDVGWLLTPEEFYDRSDFLGNGRVKDIIRNVISSLKDHPDRRFNWQETFFLKKFWDEDATEEERETLRTLVKQKRLEIVGGGWVCNDEASTTVQGIVNQLSKGHETLREMFGDDLKIQSTWQIDPFGHSRAMAVIAQQAGYKYHVMNRVDDRLSRECVNFKNTSNIMTKEKEYQFYWDTSDSDDEENLILTHVMDYHYSPPKKVGLFDMNFEHQPLFTEESVKRAAEGLAEYIIKRVNTMYRTKHIFLPFGDDFLFKNERMFSSGDKVLKEINDHPEIYNVTVKYSTASEYFESLEKANEKVEKKIPIKKHKSFMPYANCIDKVEYWTGYYSSYPIYKRLVRKAHQLYRHLSNIHSFAHILGSHHQEALDDADDKLEAFRGELGISQHHDAITGTSKMLVRDDYETRMKKAMRESSESTAHLVSIMLANHTDLDTSFSTEILFGSEKKVIPVVVQNSLLVSRSSYLKLLSDTNKITIKAVIEDEETTLSYNSFLRGDNKYDIFVLVPKIPALGYRTIYVDNKLKTGDETDDTTPMNTIENEFVKVFFDETEKVIKVTDIANSHTSEFNIDIEAFTGEKDGAYLFKPATHTHMPSNFQLKDHIKGSSVQQITLSIWGAWHATFRVYRHLTDDVSGNLIEIRVDSETGLFDTDQEFTVRFKVNDMPNDKIFYTDENNFDIVKREIVNERFGDNSERSYYAGNIYPITNFAYFESGDRQFNLFTENGFGVGSFNESEFSVLMRRNSEQDDGRGLGEKLNDLGSQSHTLHISFTKRRDIRRQAMYVDHPLSSIVVSKNDPDFATSYVTIFKPLSEDLPSLYPIALRHLNDHELFFQVSPLLMGGTPTWDVKHMFNSEIFYSPSHVDRRRLTLPSIFSSDDHSTVFDLSSHQISSFSVALNAKIPSPDPSDPVHPKPKPDNPSSFVEIWDILRFGLFFFGSFVITLGIGLLIVFIILLIRRRNLPNLGREQFGRIQIFNRDSDEIYNELDDIGSDQEHGLHDSEDDIDPLDDDEDSGQRNISTPGEDLKVIADELQSKINQQNTTSIQSQFNMGDVEDADDDQFSLM